MAGDLDHLSLHVLTSLYNPILLINQCVEMNSGIVTLKNVKFCERPQIWEENNKRESKQVIDSYTFVSAIIH